MELNIDCLRNTLLYIEKYQEVDFSGVPDRMCAKNFDETDALLSKYNLDTVYYHVKQLADSNLIAIESNKGKSPKQYIILDITPKGHEFIENIKSDTVYNKVKEKCTKIGILTVNSIQQIAIGVATELIKSQISL
ncbi:MAG: DUF2513 domain-containing protein [Anaerorhabdus sp.]|uniref:DUF2513 domain-containing protein n=1 Tax=Anaerorhabdus sp. TaxID=1872524 RepID=UPI003A86EFDB